MTSELEKRIDEEMRPKKFKVFLRGRSIILYASKAKVIDGDIIFYVPYPNIAFALDEGVPWLEFSRFKLANIEGYVEVI